MMTAYGEELKLNRAKLRRLKLYGRVNLTMAENRLLTRKQIREAWKDKSILKLRGFSWKGYAELGEWLGLAVVERIKTPLLKRCDQHSKCSSAKLDALLWTDWFQERSFGRHYLRVRGESDTWHRVWPRKIYRYVCSRVAVVNCVPHWLYDSTVANRTVSYHPEKP